MALRYRSLSPFGAEVDVDLSQPLDEAGQEELLALFRREKLLVFRDQHLSQVDQMRAVGYVGPVLSPEKEHLEMSLDDESGRSRFGYHADIWFTPEPYRHLSLYAIDIDGETTTHFINGVHAAADLPAPLRQRLAAMTATFISPNYLDRRAVDYDVPSERPQQRWPVVRAHPQTGEELLCVSELCTARLDDLPPAESEAMLGELFARLYAEPGIHRHRWRTGDLLLWDNIALQHGRDDQAEVRSRRLRRIVGAEKSVYDQARPGVVRPAGMANG
jgi:taurine dioxygenase